MKEYQRHLIACDDDDCRKQGGGRKLLRDVREALGKESRGVKCSTVSCLGQCKQAPGLLVYPDGVWYHCENKDDLEKIVKKHLIGGKVAKKQVLFKMPAPEKATT